MPRHLLHFVWVFAAAFCDARQVFLNDSMPSLVVSSTFNTSGNKKPISFLAALNYGGKTVTMGPICTEAIRIALDKINEKTDLLPNYELMAEPVDTKCSQSVGIKAVMVAISGSDKAPNRLPIMTGPYCSAHYHTGQFLEHVNFVGIIRSAGTLRPYKERNLYRNFLLTNRPLMERSFVALKNFILQMGWRKIGVVQEGSPFFNEASAIFVSETEKSDLEIIGLSRYPYLSGQLSDPEHIEKAVEEIKQADARIIVVLSVITSRVACWLHRYKLYGPNYVFLTITIFAFQSNDRLRIRPWCTEDMLEEVLGSVIFFGVANSMSLGLLDERDSLNCTGTHFDNSLRKAIYKVEESRAWWGQRSNCYDSAISVAFTLNATETLLQKRNSTLSDWVTNGEKYRENGKFINDIMKQGFASSTYRLKSGTVVLNRTTLMPEGQTNIGFFQYRATAGSKPVRLPVAIYDERTNSARMGPNPIKWNTPSGQAPSDHVRIIYNPSPAVSDEWNLAIRVIAGTQLVVVLSVWLYVTCNCKKKERISKSVPVLNSLILLGDVLLEVGVVLQHHEIDGSFVNFCMATLGFLLLGILFLIFGMLAKFELASLILFVHENPPSTDRYATSQHWQESLLSLGFRAVMALFVLIAILIAVLFASLMGAWFTQDPLVLQQSFSAIRTSDQDNSIAFQDINYSCQFGAATITKVFLGIIAGVCTLLALYAAFLAFLLRGVKNSFVGVVDLPEVINCFYFTVTLLICGTVIGGVIFAGDAEKAQIAFDVMVFTVVSANLITVFFAKVFKDDIPVPSETELAEETTLPIPRASAAALSHFQAVNTGSV